MKLLTDCEDPQSNPGRVHFIGRVDLLKLTPPDAVLLLKLASAIATSLTGVFPLTATQEPARHISPDTASIANRLPLSFLAEGSLVTSPFINCIRERVDHVSVKTHPGFAPCLLPNRSAFVGWDADEVALAHPDLLASSPPHRPHSRTSLR